MSIESLAELLRFQSELAVDRAKQNIEQQKATAEQFTPTPAQSAYIGTIFAPGSGIADASGVFPEFPSADVPVSEYLSGEPMPSIGENIAAGGLDRYVIAPLQGLGVVGDALYAVPGAGPVLGATIGSGLKGIGALGIAARAASKSAKTEKGIATLDETKNLIKADVDEFAKDEFGFVSPTLEALIREAPPNLKGPAINDWLAANTQKGVKPKELEVLGIDEFIKANPEATLSEVVAGVAPNKVQITKSVAGGEGSVLEFTRTVPEEDPLDGSLLYNSELEDIQNELSLERPEAQELILNYYNKEVARNLPGTSSNPRGDPGPYKKLESFDEIEPYLREGSGSEYTGLDDVVEKYAKEQYYNDPFVKYTAKDVGEDTFAFGNENVGFQLFVGGKRVTDPNNVPFSYTEAEIQLRNKIQDEGLGTYRVDADDFDEGFDDLVTPTQYKTYVDKTLPGGSNYREVLFRYENAPEPHNVTTHFDDDRALASALIRDRKLDDGVETLHVDELQSDLHTRGSKDGYKLPETVKKQEIDKVDKFLEGTGLSVKQPESVKGEIDIDFVDRVIFVNDGDEFLGAFPMSQVKGLANELKQGRTANFGSKTGDTIVKNLGPQKIYELEKLVKPLDMSSRAVPNYPFKDDWYVMSLKQLVVDAIDEGKDAISVSGSAPIKARYIDQYSKFYESLYDQKIPSAMKKLANKYGGKFEKGSLDLRDTFSDEVLRMTQGRDLTISQLDNIRKNLQPNLQSNIIRITPEMRAKIAEEGLTTFAFGGAVETPMRLTMPEDVNIFADAQFTQPKTLTEKIASGMTDLAFGRITKDDFFRDNVVRNVLAELDVPAIVQNNLLRSEDAQNFALNTLQQAIGSPVDVTALGDDRFALDYSQILGPGILSLAGELGSDEPSARVSYDSKDFMISPSTTARFAASLDKDRGKAFTTGVTYQPDPKTFVEGQAIFGEGISPEYRLNFGRRF
jgi:hypothetical protein